MLPNGPDIVPRCRRDIGEAAYVVLRDETHPPVGAVVAAIAAAGFTTSAIGTASTAAIVASTPAERVTFRMRRPSELA
jgi:hypothetical protein